MAAELARRQNFGAEFDMGTIEADKIRLKVDGTSIQVAADGTVSVIPTADIYVTAAAPVVGTGGAVGSITLTDTDGQTVSIPLTGLVGPSAAAGNLLGAGADGLSFLDSVVSADAGNLITEGGDGVAFLNIAGLPLETSTDVFGAVIENLDTIAVP